MAEMKSPNVHAKKDRNDTPRKRKTHIIKVRVTAEEKLRIAYACKELHLTQSELVRRVLYGVNVKHTVVVAQGGEDALAALAALSAQCSKVGSNLNQLARMLSIVRAEKHAVAPNCASCAMPCGNTNDYDLARLWSAPEPIRPLKLQMLSAAFSLAQRHPRGEAQTAIYQVLFTLAEDWDEALLLPVAENAQKLCAE